MQFTYGGPHAPQVRERLGRHRATCSTSCWRRRASWSGSATTARPAARARVGLDRATSSWASSELRGHRGRPGLAASSSPGSTPRASASTAGATAASWSATRSPTARASPWASRGGTVTDWRQLRQHLHRALHATPQNNPEGYRDSSPCCRPPRTCTASCCSCTATIDDNVHLQNTHAVRLRAAEGGQAVPPDALPEVAARRVDPLLVKHMRETMFAFTRRRCSAARPGGAHDRRRAGAPLVASIRAPGCDASTPGGSARGRRTWLPASASPAALAHAQATAKPLPLPVSAAVI